MSVLTNMKIWRVERSKGVEGDGRQRGSVDFFFFFLMHAQGLLPFRSTLE